MPMIPADQMTNGARSQARCLSDWRRSLLSHTPVNASAQSGAETAVSFNSSASVVNRPNHANRRLRNASKATITSKASKISI